MKYILDKIVSKGIFVLFLAIFSLLFILEKQDAVALVDTKTGSISSSNISGYIPSGGKVDATVKDINKYFSVDDSQLADINQCNTKKAEAENYYNSLDRQKCQDILNYGKNNGFFDEWGNWFQQNSGKAPTDQEIADCKAKEDLVKKYTIYGAFSDEYGYFYGNLSPYYDPNTGQINCAKGTFPASQFGLGDGYLSQNKISNFIGTYYGTSTYWIKGYMDGSSKFCIWRNVPYWYLTNCYNFSAEEGYRLSCSHQNTYNYSFDYQTKGDDLSWKSLSSPQINKCQEIKLAFSPIADFSATLTKNKETGGRIDFFNYWNQAIPHVPPTNILACADQTSCLNSSTEYEIAPGTGYYAKGALKVPNDFNSIVEKSLQSNDQNKLSCSNGICNTIKSGKYVLSVSTPQTSYFGQCREGTNEINTPEQTVAPVSDSLSLNVLNRAPLAYLSLDKTKVDVGDEVTATCDIQDPDTCSDKIINVKWTCYNSKNEKVDCYFNQDGIWKEGKLSKDVPDSEQSYQYRSIVKWKAGKQGVYAIACEGTDNDETSSATGKTVTGITVGPPTCEADGVCNLNCPYDPDCCGDSDYNKSHSSQCVVSAGSCTVVRTKPSLDITLINPFDQVDFQANVFGGSNPTSYTWYCDKTDSNVSSTNSTMRTDSHTCDKYSVPGKTYEPKVSYSYKDEKGTVQTQECTNVQGIGVKVNGQLGADSCSCIVLARPKGSTDTDDYSSTVKISAGNQVDAKIKKNCTKKDPTVWTTDGTKVQTSDTKALIQYDQAGIGYIKANIGGTVCTGASVDVSEKVKMGN